ncbi:MAG: 5-oxoprolinase [Epsilonproteobacteria bacterium]|nr:5-oxoprolinase [Campylobacterota bacterium]
MLKIAIDRGGTFTDIYAIYEGKVYREKILSESPFYEDSNSEGIRRILEKIFKKRFSKIELDEIEWIRLGTTVATNALLERKGADVSFLVTKGFRDLLEIRYQNREDLFALNIKKPKPLYKEVLEVDERVLPKEGGFLVEKSLNSIPKPSFDSVAVTLLHSYAFFDHEEEIAKKLSCKNISVSSKIMPSIKAVDRADTTVVDAYLTPVIEDYVERIVKNFKGDYENRLFFMKSDGGLCKADEFRGANSLLSGPAGGVVALKSIYKDTPLIGFDMGGTSTDVSRYDGEIELSYSRKIAGVYVAYPCVDIHTMAAGGGSRLFFKDGMFKVGPESSGSDPGPVCYGRGGYLSITDANLVTGRLDRESFPKIFGKSGKEPLDIEASRKAFLDIAKKVGKSVEEVAEAFIDVADENMANAIKEITVKKGFDAKKHILCSFGGAGGQHAVGVARKLGIKRVFIHRDSGILSAVGIAGADIKREFFKTLDKRFEFLDIDAEFDGFVKENFIASDEIEKSVFIKYEGTETPLEIRYSLSLREDFEKKYKRIFGFNLDKPLVVESVKIVFVKRGQEPLRERIEEGECKPLKEVEVFLNSRFQKAKLYDRVFAFSKIKGPALILQENSTVLLDEGSEAFVNEYGDIEIELKDIEKREEIKEAKISLYANRLTFIAKKMGDILQKSAISTNIKERADFSCAIFDKNGDLITNAPHIPVHLGSMSSVVKAIIKKFPKINNSSYITNVPYEGGSHLPDITVVTPYLENEEVLFWVASRGHHADIGGKVAGSMPPFSKYLWEEGAVIEAFEVVKDGEFQERLLRDIFINAKARNIEDNISDIKAQIAANMEGIKGLLELDRDDLFEFFEDIKKISAKKMREFFLSLEDREFFAKDYLDNGAKIVLKVRIEKSGKAVFDFEDSSPQLLSNQNVPYSVLKSAVLYSLRVMLNDEVPLNEGLMEPVELIIPKNSLLDPDRDLAVVGGNVTTSQRIVDVIFKAFKVAAASQGCMNNIIFGDESFGYYETLAGGAGATREAEGADGVHTHMTNTKITDVEVIERRYPVKIEKFSIRKGSGGEGRYRGGDGIVREIRFLKPLDVAVLSERRVFAPYGMDGGECGERGENYLKRGEKLYNLTAKASFRAEKNDILIIKTPGGGGCGEKN